MKQVFLLNKLSPYLLRAFNIKIVKKNLIIFILLFLGGIAVQAQEEQQVIPYTLADRDRLIRLDAEMSSLRNEMNTRFDAQQKQSDDLRALFFWGFSITITLLIFMLGYMIWDRRTALRPALTKAEEASDKAKDLTTVLREYARTHPDLAEILRTYGLL